MEVTNSTPAFHEFNPFAVPYQAKVLDLIHNWDYEENGILEILLSGSFGCLKKDTPVVTACGEVPISDITSQHYLLSFDHSRNQFCYQRGSDAFPKDKGMLYRVIGEHGEFVASGNHRISTFGGNYLPVESLSKNHECLGLFFDQRETNPLDGQLLSLSDAFCCFGTISSLINHYSKRIHQYDPRLLEALKIGLDAFPLHADAQAHAQFFYKNNISNMDDFLVLESKLFHTFESLFHTYKHHFSLPFARLAWDEAKNDLYSKFSERTTLSSLQSLLFLSKNDHPIILLLNLYHICISLNKSLLTAILPKSTKKSKIIAIEKIGVDWYWDIQVPNTNNYISNGYVHHNSAKSILMAHYIVWHCLNFENARVCLCRRALPDLKDSIYQKIIEHIEETLSEGKHYKCIDNKAEIKFSNGSEIISRSWADKKYKKFRSLELSLAAIEEVTENNSEEFTAFYKEIKARVGRLPHIPHQLIIGATNPDSPAHSAYDYFIQTKAKNRKVFYSVTSDNPFLPKTYIDTLMEGFTKEEVRRYIYGEWIEIQKQIIYYAYKQEKHFIRSDYEINPRFPIILSFDFNIAIQKPMSAVLCQYIDQEFHFFDEVVIYGARTLDVMEEMNARGYFDYPTKYIVNGDATGKARDTRGKKSDYDIISNYLANLENDYGQIHYEIDVGISNPPIRERHSLTNGQFENSYGQSFVKIYEKCTTLDKGLRLTQLKEGGGYIEDDSKPYQHVTSSMSYAIVRQLKKLKMKFTKTRLG